MSVGRTSHLQHPDRLRVTSRPEAHRPARISGDVACARGELAGASIAAVVASLVVAPIALADTCCANTSVTFAPRAAEPRDEVRVDGLACLNSDNSGPLELNLVSFWLSTDDIPADPDPGSVPGSPLVHPADDLPPVEDWIPFGEVPGAGAVSSGSATIVVPDLPRGTYQLWWLCDNDGGPGSGIHYSGGTRLKVGGAPDTSTLEPAGIRDPAVGSWPPVPLLALVGMVAFVATMRHLRRGLG